MSVITKVVVIEGWGFDCFPPRTSDKSRLKAALVIFPYTKFDSGTILQSPETVAMDTGMVDKDVLFNTTPTGGPDKAISLDRVKPFYLFLCTHMST